MRRLLVFFLLVIPAYAQSGPAASSKMELVLLGTGYPRPVADRAGPASAIVVGKKVFVVDAGRGVMMRLAAAELFPPNTIQAVFITHLHSDHISGLPDLFTSGWIFGRSRPLELYGPPGMRAAAQGLLTFFREDIHIRRDLTEMDPAAGARIHTHEVREGVVYDDGELKVTAFRVDHRPVRNAFGYRFDCAGRSIVISGDTRPSEKLVRHAQGADILVHEVYLPEYFDRVNQPPVSTRLKHYHTSADEVGEVAARAEVKMLVLTHIIPGTQPEVETIVQRAAKHYAGKIVAGEDLMRF